MLNGPLNASLSGSSLVMNAQAFAAIPVGSGAGEVALDLVALRTAARGGGALASIVARGGVWTLPLMLSGDTPQAPRETFALGDATLVVEGPKLGKVGDPGTRAYFLVDKPGFIHFGSGQEGIGVEATFEGGQVRFDPAALTAALAERGLQAPAGLSELTVTAPGAGALDGPVERRTSSTDNPALGTESVTARRIAGAADQPGRWQAHHVIPFAVIENDPRLQAAFMKASGSGWAWIRRRT